MSLPFEGRPPIFVGGLPRTGTTLVANLLASHPDVALPPSELGFFNVMWSPGEGPDRPMRGRAEFDERLNRLFARIESWGLRREEVRERSRDVTPTYRDLFVLLLDLYRRSSGRPRVAEKSVNYERWLHVLDGWFEDYRFIHVVRDPIDAFASVKWLKRGTPRPNREDVVAWMHGWNDSATVALRRSHAQPHRYCLVRYEDVVEQPAETLARICAVAGVGPEVERMLEMNGVASADNSSFADERRRAEYHGRLRRSDGVHRADRIDRRERAAIQSVCAPLAYLLGYDLAPRRRRGSLGQPVPGRVPAAIALPFLAGRCRDRLRKLSRR